MTVEAITVLATGTAGWNARRVWRCGKRRSWPLRAKPALEATCAHTTVRRFATTEQKVLAYGEFLLLSLFEFGKAHLPVG